MGNHTKTYANGANVANGGTKAKTQSSNHSTQAWRRLAQYLPSRDVDSDFWWMYSGQHLALLLEEAGYPVEKQVESLLFFYHWGVSD